MRAAIYARVSSEDQKLDMQLRDLREYATRQGWTATEYLEKESSIKKRPVFERMLDEARAGRVAVILVWRIDRFARSMKDFVTITLQLDSWKVRLSSITESVDTGDVNPLPSPIAIVKLRTYRAWSGSVAAVSQTTSVTGPSHCQDLRDSTGSVPTQKRGERIPRTAPSFSPVRWTECGVAIWQCRVVSVPNNVIVIICLPKAVPF